MLHGELKITVVEAKGLKNKDDATLSDPYVVVWIDEGHKQRTETQVGTLSPQWNETFSFKVTPHHKHIYFSVFDSDMGEHDYDNKLGEANMSITEVCHNGHLDTWINLPRFLGLWSSGELHLKLVFIKAFDSEK